MKKIFVGACVLLALGMTIVSCSKDSGSKSCTCYLNGVPEIIRYDEVAGATNCASMASILNGRYGYSGVSCSNN